MDPERPATARVERPAARLARRRRGLAVAMTAVVFGATACGGGTELADPRLEEQGSGQTAIDPTTGEEVALPEDFELAFGDDSASEDGAGEGDDGSTTVVEGPPPVDESEAPPPHPLEELVIDETESIEGEASLDESGSLACAQAEFALDALIDGDATALADHVSRAAALADASSVTTLGPLASELSVGDDPAATEDAVVALLGACTEAGYEL